MPQLMGSYYVAHTQQLTTLIGIGIQHVQLRMINKWTAIGRNVPYVYIGDLGNIEY